MKCYIAIKHKKNALRVTLCFPQKSKLFDFFDTIEEKLVEERIKGK